MQALGNVFMLIDILIGRHIVPAVLIKQSNNRFQEIGFVQLPLSLLYGLMLTRRFLHAVPWWINKFTLAVPFPSGWRIL